MSSYCLSSLSFVNPSMNIDRIVNRILDINAIGIMKGLYSTYNNPKQRLTLRLKITNNLTYNFLSTIKLTFPHKTLK